MKAFNISMMLLCILAFLSDAYSQPTSDRFTPLTFQVNGPDQDFVNIPLSRVLAEIAVRVDHDFVLFGVELATKHGLEPLVSIHIPEPAPLNDVLTEVLTQVPEYNFAVAGPHLINIFPKTAPEDSKDILNMKISGLDLQDVPATNFLSNPARFIPELKAALTEGRPKGCAIGPGLSDLTPGVTLQVRDTSLRNLLNSVSEASIAAAQNDRGAAHGWVYLHEQYPSKDEPEHVWRAYDFVWRPPKVRSVAK